MKYNLPVDYNKLPWQEKRAVREQYIEHQKGRCLWCFYFLNKPPPKFIAEKKIDWKRFPEGFLKHPVHLHHNHDTGMTEGAVHAYCNAVMWQYLGR